MRLFTTIAILLVLQAGLWCATARGDGGRLVLVDRHDEYQISVFVSPEPLRAGAADISVLLQDINTNQPIENARVFLKLSPVEQNGAQILATASRQAATNKLLYAAIVEIPNSGKWDIEISGTAHKQPIQATLALDVGERLPRWLTLWPWFCWPVGAVLLFGIHRSLVAQKQKGRSTIAV